MKLAPEWVRTSDPVIRSPARYRWTTAPAIGPRETPPPAITSPGSSTTTLISCCSATGQVIPPFFVFMGNRSTPDWLVPCQGRLILCRILAGRIAQFLKIICQNISSDIYHLAMITL